MCNQGLFYVLFLSQFKVLCSLKADEINLFSSLCKVRCGVIDLPHKRFHIISGMAWIVFLLGSGMMVKMLVKSFETLTTLKTYQCHCTDH